MKKILYKNWRFLFFLFCFATFVCLRLYIVVVPIQKRSEPVEFDDSYAYIQKAVQMISCFSQDCAALNALRPQIWQDSKNFKTDRMRWYQRSMIFSNYSPMHSILILGFRAIGFSWSESYNAVKILGAIIICLGIALWLQVLVGFGAAGCALLLLAPITVAGQGLQFMVPGNFALGIAFVTWWAVFQKGRVREWGLIGGTLFLVTMHPSGEIYASVAILFFLFSAERFYDVRAWTICGCALGLLMAWVFLTLMVDQPNLRLHPMSVFPPDFSFQAALETKINESNRLIRSFAVDRHLFFALFFVGSLYAYMEGRRKLLGAILVLTALSLAGTLFYTIPLGVKTITRRLFVPLVVPLSGVIGLVLWVSARELLVNAKDIIYNGIGKRAYSLRILVRLSLRAFLALCLVSSTIYYAESALAYRWSKFKLVIPGKVEDDPYWLDPAQPEVLLARCAAKDSILYMSRYELYFFLTHGLMDRKAVYFPGVVDTPEEKNWIQDDQSLRFLVSMNPLCSLRKNHFEGSLVLHPGQVLEVQFTRPKPIASLEFVLKAGSPDTLCTIRVPYMTQDKFIKTISVGPKPTQWQPYGDTTDATIRSLQLEVGKGQGALEIQGLKTDTSRKLNWPWNQGISFEILAAKNKSQKIAFDSSELCARLKKPIRVFMDKGSMIVAEIGDKDHGGSEDDDYQAN